MKSPHAFDPQMFSKNISPADDFFRYVNDTWITENAIPPEESEWGSFYVLRREAIERTRELLEEVSRKPKDTLDASAQKIRDFYRSGMDVEALAAAGDTPLTPLLKEVTAIQTIEDLSRVVGIFHRAGIGVFWNAGVDQDVKNSEMMVLYIAQGGLGLPDRDYYTKDDEESKAIRKKYTAFMEEMVAAAPSVVAAMEKVHEMSLADTVNEIETKLAHKSMTRVELRDIEAQYHKMTSAELATITPHVSWDAYWKAIKITPPEYSIVSQPEFMKEVDRVWSEMPLGALKQYLAWHLLVDMANLLGESFDEKLFSFYGRTFRGATEMKPRWRRVLDMLNALLDEALGKLYVEKHFDETAKQKISDLVDHLSRAYAARINALDWMSDATKEKALAKLSAVRRKLGYPDEWKDYSSLVIDPEGSYMEHYLCAYAFEFDRQMKKIGKPVDKKEWYMSPQTVNACYHPILNEILFPAAILQPPFFDPDADLAVNYGGIGTVIGHELTHGFDDQGALFDIHGNLANWWTQEDKARFDAKTAALATQYDAYEVLPGLHVNGKLTLGENIADLGGLVIACDALTLALNEDGKETAKKEEQKIDGLTPLQRFFINYAITERSSSREENVRLRVQTDPHSPSPFRVNGPLSNIEEFYKAFDVKEGDELFRKEDDRVKIW